MYIYIYITKPKLLDLSNLLDSKNHSYVCWLINHSYWISQPTIVSYWMHVPQLPGA